MLHCAFKVQDTEGKLAVLEKEVSKHDNAFKMK